MFKSLTKGIDQHCSEIPFQTPASVYSFEGKAVCLGVTFPVLHMNQRNYLVLSKGLDGFPFFRVPLLDWKFNNITNNRKTNRKGY